MELVKEFLGKCKCAGLPIYSVHPVVSLVVLAAEMFQLFHSDDQFSCQLLDILEYKIFILLPKLLISIQDRDITDIVRMKATKFEMLLRGLQYNCFLERRWEDGLSEHKRQSMIVVEELILVLIARTLIALQFFELSNRV